jgi:RimJ/RimL family protein N-acetyltransferase
VEKIPLQPMVDTSVSLLPLTETPPAATDWRDGLPTLTGALVTLREPRIEDAASLFMSLTADEVARFVSPPPASVEAFEQFIASSRAERAAGKQVCFAIVPRGSDVAVGLFHVRLLSPADNAEWGVAMASDFWGTGMFVDGARLILQFIFTVIGLCRLEARAALVNGRGNGALRKIGAVQEGVLRRSFLRNGQYFDQALWTILRDDWRDAKASWGPSVILH